MYFKSYQLFLTKNFKFVNSSPIKKFRKCLLIRTHIIQFSLLPCGVHNSLMLRFISDAPIGSPTLPNVTLEFPLNQKVTLICDTNSTDANPKCDTFLWNKTNDDTGQFPKVMFTDTLEFVMQDSSVGNYTCQCRNKYGLSEVSVPVELTVVHLETTGKCTYIGGSRRHQRRPLLWIQILSFSCSFR